MVRIITDPTNREGLAGATLIDWIETIAIAPFLFAAVVGVVLVATLLRRREPRAPTAPASPGNSPG